MKKSIDGMVIEMTQVESTLFSYFGYAEEKQVLLLEYYRGPAYIYIDVPKHVFEELLSSETPDDYFNANIRNSYKNRRAC